MLLQLVITLFLYDLKKYRWWLEDVRKKLAHYSGKVAVVAHYKHCRGMTTVMFHKQYETRFLLPMNTSSDPCTYPSCERQERGLRLGYG